MENLKIRVNSADESKEIQNILESKGFKKWEGWSELGSIGGFIWTDSDMTYCDNKIEYFDESPREEITLPELRAMVNPMKEYLDANRNYEFVLSTEKDDGFIEIPEGAIRARFYPHDPDGLEFENAFCQWWHGENQDWFYYADYAGSAQHSRVVWQREQDEPFLTPECTLNDQYAEIEKVRQHNHYFKDVSNLNEIDVYMVLKLFNVTDPCLQHIAKKALCAGQRGHKDFKKDLQDILDTAKRAVEINNG